MTKTLYKIGKCRYTTVSKTQRRKKIHLNWCDVSNPKRGHSRRVRGFAAENTVGGPFLLSNNEAPKNKGGESFMDTKPIFECRCAFFSKIIIYKDRVEVKKHFGLTTQIIPISKIASVGNTYMGIVFETTGGAKPDTMQPWNTDNKKKIVDLVFDLINKK